MNVHTPEEELFHQALETPLTERAAFLDRALGNDEASRAAVESLLKLHEEAADFMEEPAPGLVETMAAAICKDEKPGDYIGRFKLLEQLGQGGCGVVYMAEQEEPVRRRVALKVIKLGMDTKSVIARFEAERQALAMMEHPNIAKVFDAGATETGRPFFVMELVRGVSITQYCDENNLSTAERLRLYSQVCQAIQHAHQKGIIHRDIKPSNILVTLQDGAPVPKVIDFGVAKATQGRSTNQALFTSFEQFIGTPAYMSPEQAEMGALDIDTRTDVYSLGVVLYELLTGRQPHDPATFAALGFDEMRRIIREVEPLRPSTCLNTLADRDRLRVAQRRGSLPAKLASVLEGDLDWIVMKALEKDRSRRYESPSALAADLERYLGSEPVLARPPSTVYLLGKLIQRHRVAFASASAIAAALVIGLGVATWCLVRERTARVRAATAEQQEAALRLQAQAAQGKTEDAVYAAQMQNLSRALAAAGGFDPQSAQEIFESTRPAAGRPDRRGFEWRYAWQQARGDEIATLSGHQQVVDAVLFAPSGTRLATHSLDGILKVWDAATMRELRSITGVAAAGGFSTDGASFIFSRSDHTIWQLELNHGQEVRLGQGMGRLLAVNADRTKIVWFGRARLPILGAFNETVTSPAAPEMPLDTVVAVTADCRFAAIAGREYNGIVVVNLATGRPIVSLLDERPVISLALSPDGAQLVSAGFDGILKIWDVEKGTEARAFKGFLDPIWGMAFSPDGRSFAAGGNNRFVTIWETNSWQKTASFQGHHSTIRCVAFSPDGNRLMSGAEDDVALIYSLQSKKPKQEAVKLLRGPAWIDRTPSLVFSADSRLFAGTAADGTVKVWRTDTVEPVASFAVDARTVAFSLDAKSILAEKSDGIVERWQIENHQAEASLRPEIPWKNWESDPLTPEERVNMIAEQSGVRATSHTCEIPSARDGINAGAIAGAPTIAMSPSGKTMFLGLPNGDVQIWDVDRRKQLVEFAAHKSPITAIALSSDGRLLATGGLDNSTQLWDAATGGHLASFFAHNRPVWALAFSPDGQTLAAGSCDKEIILCSVPLRQHVASLQLYAGLPKGYEQEIRLLRFSPDGNVLAAALGDGTVRFFRAAPFSETDAKATAF